MGWFKRDRKAKVTVIDDREPVETETQLDNGGTKIELLYEDTGDRYIEYTNSKRQPHRVDGPAVIDEGDCDSEHYFVNGVELTEAEFLLYQECNTDRVVRELQRLQRLLIELMPSQGRNEAVNAIDQELLREKLK